MLQGTSGVPIPAAALQENYRSIYTTKLIWLRRRRYGECPSLLLRHAHISAQALHSLRLRCCATALSPPFQMDPSDSSAISKTQTRQPATTVNIANSNNGSVGWNADTAALSSSSSSTTGAVVAAKFPAVTVLPPPPNSGSLRDVVPYLLNLALQERQLAWRLAAAMSCMVVAKLAGISLPLAFKSAVDALSVAGAPAVLLQAALSAVVTYWALDCVRVVAKEAQSPVFAPVSQAVTRRVAYHTFAHVLSLDNRFHIDRRTGRLSRILERGTRSIGVLYRALIFTFLPTGLELCGVVALLASRYGPLLAALLGVTFVAYVSWTVLMTQRATDVRKEVNHLDNQASSKAVDALLNFETVTLFNNQPLEVGLYDKLLKQLRAASLHAETLAASLNAGQGLILAGGMAAILAAIIYSGRTTGGDLVLASGLIIQLWAPLQFLGWFYRELRAALVDMEDFFQILRTSSNIRDGDKPLPRASLMEPQRQPPQQPHRLAGAATEPTEGLSNVAARPLSPAPLDVGYEGDSNEDGFAGCSSSRDVDGPVGQWAADGGLSVELVDVSFGYNPERQILRGVSLCVAPGDSVAVVGSSGSGKSTILKLITRLYDIWPENHHHHHQHAGATASTHPSTTSSSHDSDDVSNIRSSNGSSNSGMLSIRSKTRDEGPSSDDTEQANEGAASRNGNGSSASSSNSSSGHRPSGVYINGVDVRQLRLEDLRSAIAVVPQDTALYFDSIRENIRYGRPDASDEDVEAAARMARLHDTVMGLPDRYDTLVGERGLKLSGGEKQRVAIARAFLRSPRLLICDEATSALDSGTEVAIMDSLKELARGRSALFVAHRLSTIRNCDRIVVLRSGVVVEEGSHEELMERGGEYAAMWKLQANQQRAVAAGELGAEAGMVDYGGVTDSDFEVEDSDMERGGDRSEQVGDRAQKALGVVSDTMDDISMEAVGFTPRAAASVVAMAALPGGSEGGGGGGATAAVRVAIQEL